MESCSALSATKTTAVPPASPTSTGTVGEELTAAAVFADREEMGCCDEPFLEVWGRGPEGKLLLQEELSWQQAVLRAKLAAGRLQRLFACQQQQQPGDAQRKQQQQQGEEQKREEAPSQYCGAQQHRSTPTDSSAAAEKKPHAAPTDAPADLLMEASFSLGRQHAVGADANKEEPTSALTAASDRAAPRGSSNRSSGRSSNSSTRSGSTGNVSDSSSVTIVQVADGAGGSKNRCYSEALAASPSLVAPAAGDKPFKREQQHAAGFTATLQGKRIAHYMTCNRTEDVLLRLAAAFCGYVPVTVNWDADSVQRILFKIQAADCHAIVVDKDVNVSHLKELHAAAAAAAEEAAASAASQEAAAAAGEGRKQFGEEEKEEAAATGTPNRTEAAGTEAGVEGSTTSAASAREAAAAGQGVEAAEKQGGELSAAAAAAQATAAVDEGVARLAAAATATSSVAAKLVKRPFLILAAEALCALPSAASSATCEDVNDCLVLVNAAGEQPRAAPAATPAATEAIAAAETAPGGAGSAATTPGAGEKAALAAAAIPTAKLAHSSLPAAGKERASVLSPTREDEVSAAGFPAATAGELSGIAGGRNTEHRQSVCHAAKGEESAAGAAQTRTPGPAASTKTAGRGRSDKAASVAGSFLPDDPEAERLVVFTSGTTGTPRGAVITNRNLKTSCSSFRLLLELSDRADVLLSLVLVNPLHHVNSSVLLELAFRYPRARVTLFTKYTTNFWEVLCKTAERAAATAHAGQQTSSGGDTEPDGSHSDGNRSKTICHSRRDSTCSDGNAITHSKNSSNTSGTSTSPRRDSSGALGTPCEDAPRYHNSSSNRNRSESRRTSRRPSRDRSSSKKSMWKNYRVVLPLVSRHVDFLQALVESGRLLPAGGCSRERLAAAVHAKEVVLLMGSAPVGERTIQNLQSCLDGKLPLIRFGSTETTLQVAATPQRMTGPEMETALQRGWRHRCRSNGEQKGFYIGRPHPPFTELRVVKSVEISHPNYMVECDEGEVGNLVCRGSNTVKKYVDGRTPAYSADGWFLGLGDVGYYLTSERRECSPSSSNTSSTPVTLMSPTCPCPFVSPSPLVESGGTLSASSTHQLDFYWVTRSADLIIKGGANYSCAQVAEDIKTFLLQSYPALSTANASVEVGVVGLKLDSEHEDSCCVTLNIEFPQLSHDGAGDTTGEDQFCTSVLEEIQNTFLQKVRNVSDHTLAKGSKPDRVRFGKIPRNFKGAIDIPTLKKDFLEFLSNNP